MSTRWIWKRRKQFLVWSPYVILLLGLGLSFTTANSVEDGLNRVRSTDPKKVMANWLNVWERFLWNNSQILTRIVHTFVRLTQISFCFVLKDIRHGDYAGPGADITLGFNVGWVLDSSWKTLRACALGIEGWADDKGTNGRSKQFHETATLPTRPKVRLTLSPWWEGTVEETPIYHPSARVNGTVSQ